jgi:hypothetical protein
VSKKADKGELRSCHYYLLSDPPAISVRALQCINSREDGLEGAVVELLSGLDDAFANAKEKKPSVRVVRNQYVKALAAICRFLSKVDPLHADLVLDLGQAMADLNVGAQ